MKWLLYSALFLCIYAYYRFYWIEFKLIYYTLKSLLGDKDGRNNRARIKK